MCMVGEQMHMEAIVQIKANYAPYSMCQCHKCYKMNQKCKLSEPIMCVMCCQVSYNLLQSY